MAERGCFFEQDGELFRPTPQARGPWGENSLHGRVIAGLIAHRVEALHGDPTFQAVRLTVDMFRLAPLAPLTVTTRMVRDGGRIRVVDASMAAEDGTEVARGSLVFLRRGQQPEGELWTAPPWSGPSPEEIEPPRPREGQTWVPMWETRAPSRLGDPDGPRCAWVRETHDLVGGVEPSGLVRLAQQADFTSPLANSGSKGLQFLNADVTLYLHREPVGEWTGIELGGHHSTDGVAIAECVLYDREGAVARASVCAVANHRRP